MEINAFFPYFRKIFFLLYEEKKMFVAQQHLDM